MRKIILILLVICLGCDKEYNYIEPYINLIEYEVIQINNPYAHLYYEATPLSRVFWTSPDSVIIEGEKTCIICCSTYTKEDGRGQQLVILPYNYNIKTWTIICYINEEVSDTIYIK